MDLKGFWKHYRYTLPPESFGFRLAVGPDARVWVGVLGNKTRIVSDGGLISTGYTHSILLLHQEEWTQYSLEELGLSSDLVIYQMACDEAGSLWMDVHHGILCRFDGRTADIFRAGEKELPLDRGPILAFVADSEGGFWVAIGSMGVCRFDGATWERFTPENSGLTSGYVTRMTLDHLGRVWFAISNAGETHFVWYDGKRWEEHAHVPIGLNTSEVEGLAVDKQGVLWVGWAGDPTGKRRPQIWALHQVEGSWTKYTAKNAALSNLVYIKSIVVDNAGRVWLGPGNGISIIDEPESVCWEAMLPGVRHGPLSRKDVMRAQKRGDDRTYIFLSGYVAVDKWGQIWTTSRGGDDWGVCVFSEA